MNLVPKVLVVTNLQNTSPLWGSSLVRNLKIILETDPDMAIKHWVEFLPDLLVLEIETEAVAIDLITKLRDETIIPILLLSSVRKDNFILDTYQTGVDEYILKPINPSLLHAKLKVWMRHSFSVPTGMLDPLKIDKIKLIPQDRNIILANRDPIHLTNLELRLLYVLMKRPSYTISIEELCHRIWGGRGGDAAKLKNVIYRLRRKIEADPREPNFLVTVAGVGYQFRAMKTHY